MKGFSALPYLTIGVPMVYSDLVYTSSLWILGHMNQDP